MIRTSLPLPTVIRPVGGSTRFFAIVTVICWSTAVVLAEALGVAVTVGVGAVGVALDGAADVGAVEGVATEGSSSCPQPARSRAARATEARVAEVRPAGVRTNTGGLRTTRGGRVSG